MVIIEIFLYCVNEHIVLTAIGATDIGGGISVFSFGGIYGVAVSWMLFYKD